MAVAAWLVTAVATGYRVGRGRHDRHVLGIVLNEFGELDVDRCTSTAGTPTSSTATTTGTDSTSTSGDQRQPLPVRRLPAPRPRQARRPRPPRLDPVSPSAAAAERTPVPPIRRYRPPRRPVRPHPHPAKRPPPARRPSPLRRARRRRLLHRRPEQTDIDSRQDRSRTRRTPPQSTPRRHRRLRSAR